MDHESPHHFQTAQIKCIGDRRIIGLIQKWLKAGVLEEGQWTQNEEGTPQGGLISPVLANIYLHYAFDVLWAHQWRKQQACGGVNLVRYADNFVVWFEHRYEAERFKHDLSERMQKFNLELHGEKTRLIEFGRYTEQIAPGGASWENQRRLTFWGLPISVAGTAADGFVSCGGP